MLGIALYAVLRIAYSVFYSPFGLRPDDLGLGYLDLLVQSAVGIVLLCIASLLVVMVLYAVFRRIKAATTGKALEGRKTAATADHPASIKERVITVTSSVLADRRILATSVLVVAALLMWRAYHDRSKVSHGHAASFTVIGFSITSWGAEDATISWTSGATARGLLPLVGRCLLYFGQSAGTAYFYNRDTRQVLRISTADVVIHTRGITCQR